MNEERLILKAAKGNKDAFHRLYRAHVDVVFRVCKRLLISQEEAEEVTQEVFIKVWNQLYKFEGQSMFSTWIYRIAVNTSVDHIRKQRVKTVSVDEASCESEFDTSVVGLADELTGLIQKLPERARVVFVLFAVEGRSHKEVASILDITEGGSKSHYARAREQLKQWWSEYDVA